MASEYSGTQQLAKALDLVFKAFDKNVSKLYYKFAPEKANYPLIIYDIITMKENNSFNNVSADYLIQFDIFVKTTSIAILRSYYESLRYLFRDDGTTASEKIEARLNNNMSGWTCSDFTFDMDLTEDFEPKEKIWQKSCQYNCLMCRTTSRDE